MPQPATQVTVTLGKGQPACPPLQIVFRDLAVDVRIKVKNQGWTTRSILKGVSGVLEPGRLTAVMGASGAGKTTFLNVLAGYCMGSAAVNGAITVNGERMDHDRMRDICGFVHQDDIITPTMTVREALVFSACLRLPKEVPTPTKVQRALDVAAMLNLDRSLDNTVGGALLKGISGGEKRRLSLGMQMVTNPSILFLDEPTSGLDTYTAHKVVNILSQVASRLGRTVVATIHQPSSSIFHQFDDLLVLADGQTMYLGPAQELVAYLANLGRVCPTYTNPSDFLFMHVLNAQPRATTTSSATPSRSPSKAELPAPAAALAGGKTPPVTSALSRQATSVDEELVKSLLQHWKVSPEAAEMEERLQAPRSGGICGAAVQGSADLATQLQQLSLRTLRNAMRNKLVAKGKLAQTIFMATVVGLIYLQISDDRRGVQDRQGGLFFITVQAFFGSVLNVLTIFGTEKPVFAREYTARLYSLPAYFFSRWFIELPIHVFFPLVSASISYWMIGLQPLAHKYLWYALILVLLDVAGAALGVFISCLFNNLEVALAVTPMFILPLMLFSGLLVNNSNIPPYFIWVPYISPMHYGFIALVKNEFSGLKIHCTPSQHCPQGYNGDAVIHTLGFDSQGSIAQNAAVLFALGWAFVSLAYVSLWFNARRLSR